ncbi:auxin efflux carrier component 5-like [Asparagus officinalis]|uniref:auxin efflux carrier component 5-like n=1 Tax=Asparagus officinalis TaxID=4686 RepID=UPI00098E320F|nr:auxin efflux carrier component 5-like [Asparagus officinalis]
MGIRLPPRRAKEAELGGDGTLVLVSVNVTRRKRRLKLDGIVRTVITLGCNRWGTQKPAILENSVTMLSNAELRMAMFSLGLFMALQPRITCGKKHATIGTLIRFITGPAVIALASVAVVIRGKPIRVSIVQMLFTIARGSQSKKPPKAYMAQKQEHTVLLLDIGAHVDPLDRDISTSRITLVPDLLFPHSSFTNLTVV